MLRVVWTVLALLLLGSVGCEYTGRDELRIEQMGLGMNQAWSVPVDTSTLPRDWIEKEEWVPKGPFQSYHRIILKQGVPVQVVVRPKPPTPSPPHPT